MSDPRDKEDFFEKVFAVVREIPFGRLSSSGTIAQTIGRDVSKRKVGSEMNV